jgi:predicted alpha/beta-hydrolase family hydrolase
MQAKKISIPINEKQYTSALLSVPDGYRTGGGTGIILAHGAGNDMTHPLLTDLSEGLVEAGYLTLRFNFLYREKGKKGVDRQDVLVGTWRSVYLFLRDHPEYRPKKILAAGKSMGGRVASQMVAAGRLPLARLIFLGYPLHPPGKKENRRDSHFDQIEIPMLFFAGTRDSLCNLAALREVLDRLPAPWELQVIEGGDHSFRVSKSVGLRQEEIYQEIVKKTLKWLEA